MPDIYHEAITMQVGTRVASVTLVLRAVDILREESSCCIALPIPEAKKSLRCWQPFEPTMR